MSQALQAEAPAKPWEDPSCPHLGQTVSYQDPTGAVDAIITRVHPPGGAFADCDLMAYYGSKGEAKSRIQHDKKCADHRAIRGVGWLFRHELPAPPPTAADLIAAGRERGERIAREGETVRWIRNIAPGDAKFIKLEGLRAIVTAVHSPTSIDLSLYWEQVPPDDSRLEDKYGGSNNDKRRVERSNKPDGWEFDDQFEPLIYDKPDRRPRQICSKCRERKLLEEVTGLWFALPFPGMELTTPPVTYVCLGCRDEMLTFINATAPERPKVLAMN